MYFLLGYIAGLITMFLVVSHYIKKINKQNLIKH